MSNEVEEMIQKLIKKIVHRVLRGRYAKKRYYSFFYFLYLQGLRGIDHGYNYIYPEQSGEIEALKSVAKYYKNKGTRIVFFDVGANTGYYAEKVLEIFKNDVDLFCFEPSHYTYGQLIKNVANRARHFQFALSNKISSSTIYFDKEGSGIASMERTDYSPPFGIESKLQEEIKTNTMDNFLEQHKIAKVHFLKLDVEGHELHVLDGAGSALRANSFDFIQFEFGRINIDAKAPLKMFYQLLGNHYNIYRIIPDGLIPQFEYNYEFEIYLGTNFLAVSKKIDREFMAATI